MKLRFIQLLFFIYSIVFVSCTSEKASPDYNQYPENVGKIIINKCATPGCHNPQSELATGGLSLASWDEMFQGSRNGPVVIPYRTGYSPLLFFTNTYSDLGISLVPTMPYNKPPLSRQEITTLNNWIAQGAPNENGFVKFSDNSNRTKFYVTNQGCDVVTVFDEATGLPMRYIDIGSANCKGPHQIKVSPDGQYWYVVFYAGAYIQKYRTSDDSYVGEINVGSANWNTMTISSDSKKAFCVDWESNGQVYYLDLDSLTILARYVGMQLFVYPHGVALNSTSTTLYVTAQTGNFIYKIDVTNPLSPNINQISLNGLPFSSTSSLDPHEVSISPDGTKYYVTCQKSNEVRVFDINNDQMIAAIPTGVFPQEMSFSKSTNYLFVSCQEDTVSFPGKRGCVSIINYSANTLFKKIFTGFQPHGLVVDDIKKQVLVANRNVNPNGPAPHHTTVCGGRDGYVTFIDMNTWELVPNIQIELSNDPYSAAIR